MNEKNVQGQGLRIPYLNAIRVRPLRKILREKLFIAQNPKQFSPNPPIQVLMIDKVLSKAREGMQRAADSVANRAQKIAVPSENTDLANELVGMKVDLLSYKANAKVMKKVSETDKEVLDLLA